MPSDTKTEKDLKHRLNLKAAILSVCVSGLLFGIKITAGVLSNSVAIIAAALDSAFDFLSSSVNLYAIRHSQKPADHKHRYGYGKAEALAGFMQGIIILASGFYLIYESVKRFFFPAPIENLTLAIGVMIVSIMFTFFLVSYQKKVYRQSNSIAIAADRLHYLTDLLSNTLVISSLVINHFYTLPIVDALAALGVAIFIIRGSIEILRNSFDILMDKDISDKYREDIVALFSKISPDILGYHDLRSRSAGDMDFLELHLELNPNLKVIDSHELVEKTMYALKEKHPNLEIIIHTDPAEIDKKSGKVKLFDREKPRFY